MDAAFPVAAMGILAQRTTPSQAAEDMETAAQQAPHPTGIDLTGRPFCRTSLELLLVGLILLHLS